MQACVIVGPSVENQTTHKCPHFSLVMLLLLLLELLARCGTQVCHQMFLVTHTHRHPTHRETHTDTAFNKLLPLLLLLLVNETLISVSPSPQLVPIAFI